VDSQVLSLCLRLKNERPRQKVVLVSKDINMRVKADALDLEAADYETDKVHVSPNEMYSGLFVHSCERNVVEEFSQEGAFPVGRIQEPAGEQGAAPLHANQFVHFKAGEPGSGTPSALGRYDSEAEMVMPLLALNKEVWGVMPKNMGQRLALELLMDDRIALVTLTGRAGTGKTLLALAAGLAKTLDERRYRRMLVTRPLIPMGKDVGYLPGDKDEKLRPWMQPVFDNLELLVGASNQEQTVDEMVRQLRDKGLLEVEALTYIRGRSIPQQYIVVDEAQNLTPHETKTIISRAGEGSKVVLTGDPFQIDHPYLDERSNGLTYVVERFKDQPLAGHVTLVKGERSRLAELAAAIL
jgi:PhoH-like ATPase